MRRSQLDLRFVFSIAVASFFVFVIYVRNVSFLCLKLINANEKKNEMRRENDRKRENMRKRE